MLLVVTPNVSRSLAEQVDYVVEVLSRVLVLQIDQVMVEAVLALRTGRSDDTVPELHVQREDCVGP